MGEPTRHQVSAHIDPEMHWAQVFGENMRKWLLAHYEAKMQAELNHRLRRSAPSEAGHLLRWGQVARTVPRRIPRR